MKFKIIKDKIFFLLLLFLFLFINEVIIENYNNYEIKVMEIMIIEEISKTNNIERKLVDFVKNKGYCLSFFKKDNKIVYELSKDRKSLIILKKDLKVFINGEVEINNK